MEHLIPVFVHICGGASLALLNAAWLAWRRPKGRWKLFVLSAAAAESLLLYVLPEGVCQTGLILLANMGLTLLFFRGPVRLQAVLVLCHTVLVGCTAYGVTRLVSRAWEVPVRSALRSAPLYMAAALTAKLLSAVICCFIWLKRKTPKDHAKTAVQWLQMLAYPCINIAIMFLSVRTLYTQGEAAMETGLLMFLVLALAAATLLHLMLLKKMEADASAQRQNQLLLQQLELQSNNMRELTRAYDEQRRAAHDFTNHLLTLYELEGRQSDEARRYIHGLLEMQQAAAAVFRTGNAVADAFLNRHYARAQAAGICMRVQTCDLSALALPGETLTVILGNLLDNAQEACARCTQSPEIGVVFKRMGGGWFIGISNSCPPDTAAGQKTAKRDKRLHGYGLRNVQAALKSCGGTQNVKIADGHYIVSVYLP